MRHGAVCQVATAGLADTQPRPPEHAPMPSSDRPVDLVHLARQTMGDRALEAEILALFARQLRTALDAIVGGDTKQRMDAAHGLKGTARSVGAFAIADCAAALEANPADEEIVARLSRLIGETRRFISAISA